MQEFVVDLAGVSDDEDMHDALAARLPLPSYYGRNLDAFYDVLTEFGCGWRIVFRHAGPAADGLRNVCRDAAEETEGLEIVFETEQRKDAAIDAR
jgi:ribonuclease inhibitor